MAIAPWLQPAPLRDPRGGPPVHQVRGRRRDVRGLALGFTSRHTAYGRRLACEEGHQRNRTLLGRVPSIIPADTPGAPGASSTASLCVPLGMHYASDFAGPAYYLTLHRTLAWLQQLLQDFRFGTSALWLTYCRNGGCLPRLQRMLDGLTRSPLALQPLRVVKPEMAQPSRGANEGFYHRNRLCRSRHRGLSR